MAKKKEEELKTPKKAASADKKPAQKAAKPEKAAEKQPKEAAKAPAIAKTRAIVKTPEIVKTPAIREESAKSKTPPKPAAKTNLKLPQTKTPMRILFAASECVPFAKTGGLADVVGALPKYLKAMGHDVRVVTPRYYGVDRNALKKHEAPLGVPMGIIGELWCGIYEGVLPGSDVPIYFVDYELYFGRESLYNEINGAGFMDNDNRFVFLSRAAMQLCKYLNFRPHILHTHDWHTSAANLFLTTIEAASEHFKGCASVLTIHNMQYQGNFYNGLMNVLAIGWEHFNFREIEMEDQVNLLKGGITHATMLSTVSPKYSQELMTEEFGYGLEATMRTRSRDLWGILNGVDLADWNPKTDKFLPKNFDAADLSGKKACKIALQKEMGLPVRDVPVIAIVSRLVSQKGIDVVAEAIHDILSLDLQFVLLGSGDPWTHFYFGDIAYFYPERFACKIGYDNALSHRIEAGADLFLMPSRFEPCGLNQMYSQLYGTLPIVHGVGGLDDSVQNYNEATGDGTGFKFYGLTAKNLFNTIGWAVSTWYNRRADFERMQKRAMSLDYGWEKAAYTYELLYLEALRRAGKFPF
ncbi:MAG: glycogen synthase GlgA [Helicobacteraceae bacterium]|nr:glycogen synthase GlgA [Helicobacteraceae bacterium]